MEAIRIANTIAWESKMWCPDSGQLEPCTFIETKLWISKQCSTCTYHTSISKNKPGWFGTNQAPAVL